MSHTTSYLVLVRPATDGLSVSVPMINRTFTASTPALAASTARALLTEHLGVQQDSFTVLLTRLDVVPTQRDAA